MFTSVDAYDRYVGRYSRALARVLIARAQVQRGQRVLDVGCGPGALTGELAALLGNDHVAAIDPSASFVEACRERYPDVHVEIAAAEAIPFEDGAFDASIAQLVVHFMTDAPAGVGEMKRVTKSGGAIAAATWDYADKMLLIRCFWDAALATDPSAESVQGRNPRYSNAEDLGGLWRDAGLTDVEVEESPSPPLRQLRGSLGAIGVRCRTGGRIRRWAGKRCPRGAEGRVSTASWRWRRAI